ncbi:hypothetical protein CJ030_MR5G009946 [Morella rubra]|uniref:Uncharacterized protein n=1 Tax=Morella rubra TaxID=262757 RepID=A0A6A1VQ15_9ROSI|nr:hypothetical protein CJ030_MR5G009946 [Morella rubra]
MKSLRDLHQKTIAPLVLIQAFLVFQATESEPIDFLPDNNSRRTTPKASSSTNLSQFH